MLANRSGEKSVVLGHKLRTSQAAVALQGLDSAGGYAGLEGWGIHNKIPETKIQHGNL